MKYLDLLIKTLENEYNESKDIFRCEYHGMPCVRIEIAYEIKGEILKELKTIKEKLNK